MSLIPGLADSEAALCHQGLRFFTSLHCSSSVNQCCPRAGFPHGAEKVTIPGITSRHNNVQRKKGNVERELTALSLESDSFAS